MPQLSYLSPKTVVKESAIHGRGLFAKGPIAKDEIVAVKGGHIISRQTLDELGPRLGPAEIQIADDLFICPIDEGEREGSMIFSNHSCEPNIGPSGQIVFVAMREIESGEELTHDWAMTDDDDSSTVCRCGAPTCRGTITGKDWQRPELRQRYGNYFSAYLLQKMRRALAITLLAFALGSLHAEEEVIAEMEEIQIEGSFSDSLELKQAAAIKEMVARLMAHEEATRALELKAANETLVTRLFDLTKYSPIQFGAGDSRADSFFFTRSYALPERDHAAERLFEQ